MHLYAVIALATAAVAWLLTPLCGRLATKLGVVDEPDVRKVHKEPTPYFGGVAIYASLVIGGLCAVFLAKDSLRTLGRADASVYAIVAGASLMFLIGLLDDARNLRARHKLLAQLAAAFAVCATGARIEHLHLTESFSIDLGAMSWVLTMLWIVGLTNAVNLIDGLDGLATGIGAIAAAAIIYITLGHWAESAVPPHLALLCGLFGALVGFLPHNHRPAKIFLGDAGSLLIGFLLATSALVSSAKTATFATVAVPAIALIALGIPVFDTLFAMLRRVIEGRGLMSPDKSHIHHRLMQRGLSHRMTVYALWAETAIATMFALLISTAGLGTLASILAFAAFVGMHVLFFRQAGAVRLRESFDAMKGAAKRAQANGETKRAFDALDLGFQTIENRDHWWDQACTAAADLGVLKIEAEFTSEAGETYIRSWRGLAIEAQNEREAKATLPATSSRQDMHGSITMTLPGDDLEHFRRTLGTLSRLLEKHPLPDPAPFPSLEEWKTPQALAR